MTAPLFDITHKRGTTFSYAGPGTLPTGTWSARSQIRERVSAKILATLVCTVTPDNTLPPPDTHILAIECSDDTSNWPPGAYVMDVKFYGTANVKIATQTLQVQIVDRVTHDG